MQTFKLLLYSVSEIMLWNIPNNHKSGASGTLAFLSHQPDGTISGFCHSCCHSTLPPLFSFLKLLKADPRHHTFPFHTSMCLPRNYGHFSYITAMLLSHLGKVKLFCVSFNMQPIFTFLCLKNVYSWFIWSRIQIRSRDSFTSCSKG